MPPCLVPLFFIACVDAPADIFWYHIDRMDSSLRKQLMACLRKYAQERKNGPV